MTKSLNNEKSIFSFIKEGVLWCINRWKIDFFTLSLTQVMIVLNIKDDVTLEEQRICAHACIIIIFITRSYARINSKTLQLLLVHLPYSFNDKESATLALPSCALYSRSNVDESLYLRHALCLKGLAQSSAVFRHPIYLWMKNLLDIPLTDNI